MYLRCGLAFLINRQVLSNPNIQSVPAQQESDINVHFGATHKKLQKMSYKLYYDSF